MDSVESFSPRSTDLDEIQQVPGGAKLRLMCSFGGHIIPRPHDKTLSYIGGETRLVVVDRQQFSLAGFCSRLSRTLVNGRPFALKYQLPTEDLDSLVSISTDEDLENMIEEYDRISTSPARIRLFLFFTKPETTASMGSLLDDAKSETWFVDALNQSGLFKRNLSDSATMDCVQPEDSQMFGNGSSTSTSPSMANLPPIRTRVDEDQRVVVGMEEQFGRLTFSQVVQKQDDGFGMVAAPRGEIAAAPPPLPMMTVAVPDPVSVPSGASGYSAGINRAMSDDERSDQGVPVAFRKPPLPLHQGQVRPQATAPYNLPSPDSVTSDCSIASSANSLAKQTYYQDHTNNFPTGETRTPDDTTATSQIQTQDSGGYTFPQPPPPPQQQQQFAHMSMHYVPHQTTTQVPMYQTYAPPPGPPQSQHHPMDQQYVQYIMHMPQTQQYSMAVQQQQQQQQPNLGDATTLGSPIRPPNPNIVPASAMYKAGGLPPPPQMVAANQYQQQQYMGFSQVPQQSISTNYGYEYSTNPAQDQVYYAQGQHQAVGLPPQYHSMAPRPPQADSTKQQPSADH
ncbi:hypothetical protein ACFE04_011011 [Oxalis oulophora]